MANTYANILIHVVFSTKDRQSLISSSLRERFYPYMGGITKKNEFKILCVGGTEDHVHIFFSLNTSISIAKAGQLIKGGTSKWIHDIFPTHKLFSWQEGYGAFSVSISNVEEIRTYIEHQEYHHKKISFRQKYLEFLKRNNIDFDEKYVFG